MLQNFFHKDKIFRFLSTIILILAIVLFPPAVLAYASSSAIPGDELYPVKRTLEDGILVMASISPTTKAWYSLAYSQRRFTEASSLINKGENKEAIESLNELVSQTDSTVKEIKKIKSSSQKTQLIDEVSKSVDEYDKSLTFTQENITKNEPSPTPTITPTSIPTPAPSVTTLPIPTPTPTATPAPEVAEDDEELRKEIEETKKELERIQQELEAAKTAQPQVTPAPIAEDSLEQALQDLDLIDLDGLNNTFNQTIIKYNSLFF